MDELSYTPEVLLTADMLRRRYREAPYDPVSGRGCAGARRLAATPLAGVAEALLPESMLADSAYGACAANETAWKRLRCRHDFEYWAFTCVTVKDKESPSDIPFRLNAPQRRVVEVLEHDRIAGRPLRLILLKARQWGGSTLVQMYMAWIQCVHRTNWHSVICAHVKDTSATIRGMYSKMLSCYPEELWEGPEKPEFRPYERSINVRQIAGRECRVTIGSSENPDSFRGGDYAMAHLSETAFWADSRQKSPRAVIQAICGSIGLQPYTFVAIESTANGVGDYFHNEWQRNKSGAGDKHAVFVPWHEIDFYRYEPPVRGEVLASLTPYEKWLWTHGCCTDQLYWRRCKLREFETPEQMYPEFPGDDAEAFLADGATVFANAGIERLRAGCSAGTAGEMSADGSGFVECVDGRMRVWRRPWRGRRYVAAVDIGGRSAKSDWSVIAVLECDGDRPEVVAQWRGHIDHDLLAAKAMAIARHYNNALLVIESNTLEAEAGKGDPNLFVLNRLAENYQNVYMRESYDSLTRTTSRRVGFHTNRSTKALLISGLIEAVREGLYVERDAGACDELAVYQQLPSGSYGAKEGYHDDILMTRAMALHVIKSGNQCGALPERYEQAGVW